MGQIQHSPLRFEATPVDAGAGSASLLACAAARVAAAMSSGQHVGLRTEDMIRCPRVPVSCAFAADVAVGGGLPHESSTFGIVAFVVRAACVAYGFPLTSAGVTAGCVDGESPALDAWAVNGHGWVLGLRLVLDCSGTRRFWRREHGCYYVTHPCPFVWQGFQFRVP
jgi:hypothetical protein